MAVSSFPLDNTDYTAEDLGAWCAAITRGVLSSDGHFPLSIVSGTTISLGKGLGWLKKDDYWGATYYLKDPVQMTSDIADSSLSRYDAIVFRLDKTNNIPMAPFLRKGILSQNPTIPTPIRNDQYDEIIPYAIKRGAGTTQIYESDIQDLRLNETYCGLMRDGITKIPTQQLIDSWTSWFEQFKASSQAMVEGIADDTTEYFTALAAQMQDLIDGNAAGKLQNQINVLDDDVDDLQAHINDWATQDGAKLIKANIEANAGPAHPHGNVASYVGIGATGDLYLRIPNSAIGRFAIYELDFYFHDIRGVAKLMVAAYYSDNFTESGIPGAVVTAQSAEVLNAIQYVEHRRRGNDLYLVVLNDLKTWGNLRIVNVTRATDSAPVQTPQQMDQWSLAFGTYPDAVSLNDRRNIVLPARA